MSRAPAGPWKDYLYLTRKNLHEDPAMRRNPCIEVFGADRIRPACPGSIIPRVQAFRYCVPVSRMPGPGDEYTVFEICSRYVRFVFTYHWGNTACLVRTRSIVPSCT